MSAPLRLSATERGISSSRPRSLRSVYPAPGSVVDGVPSVIGSGHVVEEEQGTSEELQRYQEEVRTPKGVNPGAPHGRWLVEELFSRAVITPVLCSIQPMMT